MAEKVGSSPMQRLEFTACCQHKHVHISHQSLPPGILYRLFKSNEDEGKEFHSNICQYNMALAFTSLGIMEDRIVNHQEG